MENFSVLMSIYINTKLSELQECMNSLFNQSVKSNDIVIVFDGPVSKDVENYLDELTVEHKELNLVKRDKNCGQGIAIAAGMKYCKNELIARMDSDDICVLDRFEKQLLAYSTHPECSVIGGNISEFIGDENNQCSVRNVPENHNEICEFLKKRCPFNQMTVMIRKSDVEKAGGYLDWHWDEDYYLWIRMYLSSCKFYNIQDILCYVRVDDIMNRRGGYKYYKSERNLFKFMRKNKIIGAFAYFKAKCVRFIAYVLLPNKLREWAFKKFVREKN